MYYVFDYIYFNKYNILIVFSISNILLKVKIPLKTISKHKYFTKLLEFAKLNHNKKKKKELVNLR